MKNIKHHTLNNFVTLLYSLTMMLFLSFIFGLIDSPFTEIGRNFLAFDHLKQDSDPNTTLLGAIEAVEIFLIHFLILLAIFWALHLIRRIAVYGSLKEARKAMSADLKKANARVDLGKVKNVEVDRGGFLDATISTIETEKGIYRVFGDVGSVEKGELCSRRQGDLFLGLSSGKSFEIKR